MKTFLKPKTENPERSKEIDFTFIEMLKKIEAFNIAVETSTHKQVIIFEDKEPDNLDLENVQDTFNRFRNIMRGIKGSDFRESIERSY